MLSPKETIEIWIYMLPIKSDYHFFLCFSNYIVFFDVKMTRIHQKLIFFFFIRISKILRIFFLFFIFCNCICFFFQYFFNFPFLFFSCISITYTSQNILIFRRHVGDKSTFGASSKCVHRKM